MSNEVEHSAIYEKAKSYYRTILNGKHKWSEAQIRQLGGKGLLTEDEVAEILGEDVE